MKARVALLLSLLLGVALCQAETAPRIVSVGGAITETIYALGAGDRLVGVDTSSLYPEAATKLPQVGYARTLSAEGVLSLRPSLLLLTADAGPPAVLRQLREAGVPSVVIPAGHGVPEAAEKIRRVAVVLGSEERGEKLATGLLAEAKAVAAEVAAMTTRPRVLFLYARSGGTLNVAGADTAADAMIAAAGGVNAVTGYTGYRPLTAEAAVAAAPDVVLVTRNGLESLGGPEKLFALPSLAPTPAARARRVVVMDDLLLLGFGPRTGQALRELAAALHPHPSATTVTAATR